MNKINSKLILSGLEILVILAFGLIVLIPNETKAERPYYIPYYYFNPQPANNPITNYSNPVVYSPTIVGCEGRNTGFSTVTGQSCVGNYINNPTPTTVVRNYTYNTTNTTVPATVKEIVNQEPLKDNEVTAKANDINESYGSLTANALFGSDSFMPSGLLQWILFVLLVVGIIFLWRYIHHSEEKYMSEPMKHA